ncbi:MAG: hypothetical protein AAF384_11855, partial [Pseudomonadota bacterium]
MLRTPSTILTMALFSALNSHALVLGEIQTSSTHREPFRASIPILDAGPAQIKTMQATLPSEIAYRVGNQPYTDDVNGLAVSIVNDPKRPHLKIAGVKPVREPYLELIVDVETLDQKFSRTFTTLFDPDSKIVKVPRGPGNVRQPRPPANPGLNRKVPTGPHDVGDDSVAKASHGMESHSMESEVAKASHGMESNRMESEVAKASHGMESHRMEREVA